MSTLLASGPLEYVRSLCRRAYAGAARLCAALSREDDAEQAAGDLMDLADALLVLARCAGML